MASVHRALACGLSRSDERGDFVSRICTASLSNFESFSQEKTARSGGGSEKERTRLCPGDREDRTFILRFQAEESNFEGMARLSSGALASGIHHQTCL